MAVAHTLRYENVWLDKYKYDDAERLYHENKAKEIQTPLAAAVGRAREWLTNIKNSVEEPSLEHQQSSQLNPLHAMEAQLAKFNTVISSFEQQLVGFLERITKLEELYHAGKPTHAVNLKDVPKVSNEREEEDVDLFGSDSEEDEAAQQVRQKRLADYEAKKSKKPTLIAKSNIILDVKPWDDETDMKRMEQEVRAINTEGLVWGAAKLVPLAYGIHKLQISCVVEDDIVSVDWLQEQLEGISDYVQSVDIAAFNKV